MSWIIPFALSGVAGVGGSCLRHLRSLCAHVYRVKRLAGRHEQPVLLGAAETQVGAGFRKMDSANQDAVRREYVHSVETVRAPSRGRPDIAIHVTANAIRRSGSHVHKLAPVL